MTVRVAKWVLLSTKFTLSKYCTHFTIIVLIKASALSAFSAVKMYNGSLLSRVKQDYLDLFDRLNPRTINIKTCVLNFTYVKTSPY